MLKSLAAFIAVASSFGFVLADEKSKTPQPPQKDPVVKAPAKDADVKKPDFKKVQEKKPDFKKVEVKPAIKVEVKATVKVETKPAAAVAAWIPKELHGTPTAKRLMELQSQIDTANAKRGPARAEADKARAAANAAEHQVSHLDGTIKSLELEKVRTIHNAQMQQKEFAQQKATIENAQQVQRLQKQVQDLTARLEASLKQQAEHAESCRTKDAKPAATAKTPAPGNEAPKK
jgi:hypothetical protein